MVEWLNSLPVVQEIVEDYFDGREVTEQNLSVWRQGGFVEWQRNQERRGLMREFLSEAEELEEEIKDEGEDTGEPLTDRLAGMVALELAVLLREAMKEESAVERRKAVLEIARELGRLRRGDHQRRRVVLQEARWATECDEKFEAECQEMKRAAEHRQLVAEAYVEGIRENCEKQLKAGKMSVEEVVKVGEKLKADWVVTDWVVQDNRPREQREGGAAGGSDGVKGGAGMGGISVAQGGGGMGAGFSGNPSESK